MFVDCTLFNRHKSHVFCSPFCTSTEFKGISIHIINESLAIVFVYKKALKLCRTSVTV